MEHVPANPSLNRTARRRRWRAVRSRPVRFSSVTTCPKCGSALVLRVARAGANAGSQFYGCTKYPACRYTAKAESTLASRTGATFRDSNHDAADHPTQMGEVSDAATPTRNCEIQSGARTFRRLPKRKVRPSQAARPPGRPSHRGGSREELRRYVRTALLWDEHSVRPSQDRLVCSTCTSSG